ncbi:unnamed protein product [Ectocarpus sp. 13 AM-2016]
MPGHDEEHKGGAGRHEHGGKGEEEHHGRPGHKHEGGAPGAKGPGHTGGRRRHKAKRRPDDDEDTDDEDSEDEDDGAGDEEEEKCPGLQRAGRVAAKAWKKRTGAQGRIRDMTPAQKEEVREVVKQARVAFRDAHGLAHA